MICFMKKIHQTLALIFLFLLSPFVSGHELVSIPSLDGKLMLPGYWFPVNAKEPRPAVITLHGCNGALDDSAHLNRSWMRDAGWFNAEKMHLLVLDSFTPRGLKSICDIPPMRRTIQEEDRRNDVFAAIQWLAQQPGVDRNRIVIMGRSHGGQTALSVLDRSDKAVQAQTIQPRAVIALYPGCVKFTKMWNYELSAPLLLMIGESDDWTQAKYCVELHEKVKRAQKNATFELHVFPNSYHAFDSTGPVRTMTNVGGTRSGTATVGGNPEAREKAHRLMFDFLSAQWKEPLLMTHEERMKGHHYAVPAASGFASIHDIAAVPLAEAGRSRYAHYLEQPAPKAFVITEKNGWFFSVADPEAMRLSMSYCRNVKCWLYAVDDRVVWEADVSKRIDHARLVRQTP